MQYNKLPALAMDSQDFICYMTDTETNELLYLNEMGRQSFGLMNSDDYIGKQCYKILQGKDKPCEFCNNDRLEVGRFIKWEITNPLVNKSFSLTDTLVMFEGRKVRVEMAFDITKQKGEVVDLSNKLSTEETLVKCIHTLTEKLNIDEAINSLLEIVCDYYKSDRAYIFELNHKEGTADNTYEWCDSRVLPDMANWQGVPIEYVAPWLDRAEKDGKVFITDLENQFDEKSEMNRKLRESLINSMFIAPLIRSDKITGFIGVDNPTENNQDVTLLRSVSYFVQNDISKKRLYAELEKMSYTDTLTGLFNRNKYSDTVRRFEEISPQKLGILYADVNGLKHANEIFGHAYGDSVIIGTAKVLHGYFGGNVYRTGGDEFIAFCENIEKSEFDSIVENIRKSSKINETCSFTVASSWKESNVDIQKELTRTDEMLHAEKQLYYKTVSRADVTGASSENLNSKAARELVAEIEAGLFEVYLQPKVELSSGAIMDAEALIRKRDKSGGIITPVKFIPVYEYSGIIRHVDFFVLESVCKFLREQIDIGKPLQVSINFSRVTFMEHDIVRKISAICKEYDVPHEYIDVEITESIEKLDNKLLQSKMTSLIEAGFSVSLDDFGAQYSNLHMLSTMDFSLIKLDKSLVDEICVNKKSYTVVKNIIAMVKELNDLKCLAEGVETVEQRDMLMHFGCDYGQGYLFYKPMPIESFKEIYNK